MTVELYVKNLIVFIWLCDGNNFWTPCFINFEALASNMECDIKVYKFCKISLLVHILLICENWFVFFLKSSKMCKK